MDKFESVVLIAFGTTFMPSEKDMMKLFEMVKLADPTKMGFIISLKEKLSSFAKIKEANPDFTVADISKELSRRWPSPFYKIRTLSQTFPPQMARPGRSDPFNV